MAVEAHHLQMFSNQLINNRQMMIPIEGNAPNIYNNTNMMGYGIPLSGTTTETPPPSLFQMYNNNTNVNVSDLLIPQRQAMNSVDSSLTYNHNINNAANIIPTSSRKRFRDDVFNSVHSVLAYPPIQYQTQKQQQPCNRFSFLDQDFSYQIQEQQLDIDQLISHHMERVKMEIEEKRKRETTLLLEAIEQGVMKKLQSKEEEISKLGKTNLDLEDRIKSLSVENQIWREMAHNNQVTANLLRNNLEQVLTSERNQTAAAVADDAQSCCGSNGGGEGEDPEEENEVEGFKWRTLSGGGAVKDKESCVVRMCRNCGEEEACVLLLPCRHLCLCTVCGCNLHICPVCKSTKNGSVHVNFTS